MTRYNIDTSALLVEFNASIWTARKLDKSTTDEVINNKSAAAKDAARVNKNLLAGRPELELIQQHINRARTYVYDHTMPWSDTGIRLLPTKVFMSFTPVMAKFDEEFKEMVKNFIDVYPTLITAQAMALGDMFKRDDYPTPAELNNKFSFRVGYMPVPTSGDFRVDVGNAAAEELRNQLEKLHAARVDAAIGDVRARLGTHLKRMAERLDVDVINGETKTRRFHDSLVEGAVELCDLVGALNITNDPELEEARRVLSNTLAGVSADELRRNLSVRSDVRKEVTSLLDKFSF